MNFHPPVPRELGAQLASLEEFSGHPAYDLHQLRGDLERFVFLRGGSDAEQLFGSWPAVWLPLSPGSIFHGE